MTEHPEDTKPLGESYNHYSTRERLAMFILAVCLILSIVAIPVVAILSWSPSGNVFLGLSPLIVMIILQLMLVSKHFKRGLLWGVLVIVHLIGLAALFYLNALLATPLNVPAAVGVSLLLGVLVTLLAWLANSEGSHGGAPAEEKPVFTPEKLPELVQSIEDKAKGLNFAIGRVYRNSNGGSAKLRERLRVPRDWYNEFTEASEEERTGKAKVLVGKIHDRLLTYQKEEKALFSEAELKKLKNVSRKKKGGSTLLEVLITNDSDPVENYYNAAIEVCEQVLSGLK